MCFCALTPVGGEYDEKYRAGSSGSNAVIVFVYAFMPQTLCLLTHSAIVVRHFGIRVHIQSLCVYVSAIVKGVERMRLLVHMQRRP